MLYARNLFVNILLNINRLQISDVRISDVQMIAQLSS